MQVSLTKTESMYDVEMSLSALKILIEMGWKVEAINGDTPAYTCETCGLPILENDQFQVDSEGVAWHDECPEPQEWPEWPDF